MMMLRVAVLLIVVFALMDVLFPAYSAIVLTPPQSVNAIEGDPIVFSCTVMAKEIDFFVDGEIPSEPSVVHKKFIEGSVIDINDTTKQQTLTAIAHTDNNNTNITCRALTIGNKVSFEISDPALLLVQGPLASVVNLSYSFIDSSTVNVSWNPPFTLPGTDIIGYNISVKQFYDGRGIDSTAFTVLEYYLFLNYSQCGNKTTITVSGYNGLKGENASTTIDPASTKNEISVTYTFDLPSSYEYFILKRLYLNVSSLCPGEYPTHVNLTILYNNGTLVTTIDSIPLVSTNDTNTLATPNNDTITLLSVDNDYIATITVSYFDNNISSVITLKTYAIRVIANDTVSPSVAFVCHFSPYSDAVGCLIELVYSNDTTVRFNSTGTRTGDDIAIVTIDSVYTAGVYELLVYEIEGYQTTLIHRRLTITLILIKMYTSMPVSSAVLQTTTTMTTALDVYVSYSAAIRRSTVNVPTDKTEPNSSMQAVPYIAVGVTMLIVTVLLIAILWPLICCLKKSKKQKELSPTTDINSAYLNPRILISSLPPTHELMENSISIDQNPSYAQVHISKPTEEHVYENLHS